MGDDGRVRSVENAGALVENNMLVKQKNVSSTISSVIGKKNSVAFKSITKKEIEEIVDGSSPVERSTNISEKHAKILSDFCGANDTYVVLRPVNETARHWLAKGAVGKNMFVHGKSVASGPASGLISFNASISKSANRGEESIKLAQHDNEHSIEQSDALLEKLEGALRSAANELSSNGRNNNSRTELLNFAKISEDAFDPIVQKVQLTDKNDNEIYILTDKNKLAAKDASGNNIYVVAENDRFYSIDDNHEKIKEITIPDSLSLEPLEVIGKPEIEISQDGSISMKKIRPITADIDVLAYGAIGNLREGAMEDHSSILKAQKVSFLESIKFPGDLIDEFSSKNPNELKATYSNESVIADELERIESKFVHLRGMGGATRPILDITGAMRGDFRSDELSHGSEQFNYYFPQPLDKEWVVVAPNSDVKVITGESSLLGLFNEARAKGYSMPPSPHWGWTMDRTGKYVSSDSLKQINEFVNSIMYNEDKGTKLQRDKVVANRLLLGLAHISSQEEWSSSLEEIEPKMKFVGMKQGIKDVNEAIAALEENQTQLNQTYTQMHSNYEEHEFVRSGSMYSPEEQGSYIESVKNSIVDIVKNLHEGITRRLSLSDGPEEKFTSLLPDPKPQEKETKTNPLLGKGGLEKPDFLKEAIKTMSGVVGKFIVPSPSQKGAKPINTSSIIAALRGKKDGQSKNQ